MILAFLSSIVDRIVIFGFFVDYSRQNFQKRRLPGECQESGREADFFRGRGKIEGMAKKGRNWITKKELQRRYPWLTDAMINKYLPPRQSGLVPGQPQTMAWPKREIIAFCSSDKRLLAAKKRSAEGRQREERERQARKAFIQQFTPERKFQYAQRLNRRFVLHIGPTNSGKTYTAMEALKQGRNGVYLGPLRLLALEMFDKLNGSGYPCSLLTGEENIPVAGANFTASTIEMADFRTRYDTAVIDEAQMISDPDRGAHWLDALCRIDAETLHVCLAPEAEEVITDVIERTGAPYEIVRHERLAPLVAGGPVMDYLDIRPNDAVIAFSRRAVLGIAGSLEQRGLKPAVIYGSLPPAARRTEVAKYTSGECDVVVATDAIGMGVSLPIKRIVFSELQKFDGKKVRPLTHSEILQIAGRAGRYGMFDEGEVSAIGSMKPILAALNGTPESIEKIRIAFPGEEAIASEFPLKGIIEDWQALMTEDNWYDREDMSDALFLLNNFPKKVKADKDLMYRLITCPMDIGNPAIVEYWSRCAIALAQGKEIPTPNFGLMTLEKCETQYRGLDLYHHLCVRFDRKDYCQGFRDEVVRRIAQLLKESKDDYIRTCSRCGCELPISTGNKYRLCRQCRKEMHMA